MAEYATVEDLELLWRELSADEEQKAEAAIPIVCALLRKEADKEGKDLDAMVVSDEDLAAVAKIVTCDITARYLRQSTEGEAMTQESQSGLGYSWSGTYATPGGGLAGCVMRNDLKRLGLKRQTIGVIEIYDTRHYGTADQ